MNIQKSFEILRLDPDTSVENLVLAYKDLVNVWHPDRFLHHPRLKEKAERQLQEINMAYETALAFLSSSKSEAGSGLPGAGPIHSRGRPAPGAIRSIFLWLPSLRGWQVRFLARAVDGIFIALILGYIEAFRLFRGSVAGGMIAFFGGCLLWAFVEANLLSIFGTTPGRWLLNVRVLTRQGKKPVLLEAFKRSMGVWWFGLGAGFLPATLVMLVVNCVLMLKKRSPRWDRTGHFVVILDSRGFLKTFGALLAVVLGFLLLIFLWREQHR